MVNSVTNNYLYCMYLVKKTFLWNELFHLFFLFEKNENYVQRIKYIMIAEVYLSHIGFKTSWHTR